MKVCDECDGRGELEPGVPCDVCEGLGEVDYDLDDPYDVPGGLLPLTAIEQKGMWL